MTRSLPASGGGHSVANGTGALSEDPLRGEQKVPLTMLFPFPMPPSECVEGKFSRRCRQRQVRRHRCGEDVRAVVLALNWLGGKRRPGDAKCTQPISDHSFQSGSVDFVRECVLMAYAPGVEIPRGEAAFSELLHGRACYDVSGNSSGASIARFSDARDISLPESLAGAPALIDELPVPLHHFWRIVWSEC